MMSKMQFKRASIGSESSEDNVKLAACKGTPGEHQTSKLRLGSAVPEHNAHIYRLTPGCLMMTATATLFWSILHKAFNATRGILEASFARLC